MRCWIGPREGCARLNTALERSAVARSATLSLSEFAIIDRFFKRANAPSSLTRTGIGDDAAVLSVPAAHDLVAAVDTIVEGRHFLPHADPRSISHRALAVNLSDLAAMGATPRWALLALTLPLAEEGWLQSFAKGWFELADRFGVELVGGDTTGGPLTISVQLMGHLPLGSALLRSGGRAGDLLAVTGSLGDAGAGLAIARSGAAGGASSGAECALRRRFEYPEPRIAFGSAARGIATAAMDLSDGLAGDLPKLAAASGLGAHVRLEQLPLSKELLAYAAHAQARSWAVSAGDDYELLLSVPPRRYADLAAIGRDLGVPLTVIGELGLGEGVTWSMDGQSAAAPAPGFDHFR